MGAFFSFFRSPVKSKTLMVGLDAAGKTTILYKLNLGEYVLTIPTLGFNVENVENGNVKFQIWDVGGQDKLRRLWKHYYNNTHGIIYVIDSSDLNRVDEAINELKVVLSNNTMNNIPLLIYANKQDIKGSITDTEILHKISDIDKNEYYVQSCSTKTGEGLINGIEWLTERLKKKKK